MQCSEAQIKAEAVVLKQQLIELQAKYDELHSGRDRVLETALSGSVRLCIVAPTVNVHVADKKLNFRAKCVCTLAII